MNTDEILACAGMIDNLHGLRASRAKLLSIVDKLTIDTNCELRVTGHDYAEAINVPQDICRTTLEQMADRWQGLIAGLEQTLRDRGVGGA